MGNETALATMNGHYLILIYDRSEQKIVLATDRCGMVPCFKTATSSGSLLFSTHPDILAEESGQSQKWDRVAMAEFLMTGKLSFPYTLL